MQGFRILNPNLAPLANPTVDPGFRDDTSIPSFDPILEGLQNKNFTALKLPKYVSYEEQVAKEKAAAAAAAAKKAKQKSDQGNTQVGIGNDYWNGQYQGDGGGWDNEGPGDFGGGDNYGGGAAEDTDDPMGWSYGGKIPPMYAYDGLTKQERDRIAILAQQEAAKPKSTFDFTPSVPSLSQLAENANKIKENIGGTISTTSQNLFNTGSDILKQETTPKAIQDKVFNAFITASLKSNPYTAPLAAFKTVYDIAQTVNNYAENQKDQTETLDPGFNPGSTYEPLPSELNTGITNPADFNFKDFNYGYNIDNVIANNYGAIPSDYSSPSTSGITEYDPTAINSWEDLGSYISAGLQNDYDYGLTSEDTSYNEKVSQALADELSNPPTSGGSSFSGNSSGGDSWGDGGMGFDASDAASGADDPMGDGSGSFGANDDDDGGDYDPSFSKGGYVYASQGGYVNSTGGK